MARYVAFANEDGSKTLVEIEGSDAEAGGSVKAGLLDQARGTVFAATATLREALSRSICESAEALYGAVSRVSEPPTEIEVTFGLKASGEAGVLAVGKVSGESNYSIKLVWKRGATVKPG